MKYSVVMPYTYNRDTLLYTLNSYVIHYGNRSDYEVVVVEEKKNIDNPVHHSRLGQILERFRSKVNIKYLQYSEKEIINSSVLFNYGVRESSGDIVVITNPEIYHETNVLGGFDEEFAKDINSYVVCGCLSVDFRSGEVKIGRWYQHSMYINRMSHFCSAISRENYLRIGGFDEEYGKGIAYDDDDFRETVLHDPILKVRLRDDLLVTHLEHSRDYQSDFSLVHRNELYYRAKWKK